MSMDVTESMSKTPNLKANGLDDVWVAMTDGSDPEPRSEVDVAIAIDIENVASTGFLPNKSGAIRIQGVGAGGFVAL